MNKFVPAMIAALFAVVSSATLVQAAEPSGSASTEMKPAAKAKAPAKAKSERTAKRNTARKSKPAAKK